MRVGIPREVKNHEYRVAITPAGTRELVSHGHEVYLEKDAGAGSSLGDDVYVAAGATILPDPDEVWGVADLVLKVKEPVTEEYHRMRKGQVLFTYLHLAADRACTDALLESSGNGVLMGGVPGTYAAKVVVIGAGVSGHNAAQIAAGMGARVLVLDRNIGKLRQLDACYQGRIQTIASNAYEVERAVRDADLVIGAVLLPGARAPKVVSNDLVRRMKPGSVLVDISIDQGGCFEDSRPTTHAEPTYQVYNSVFYCVANMPGAVPHTST